MSTSYDHEAVEDKWRRHWLQDRTFEVDLAAATRPYYNLMMFPYPSAEGLHMGNLFSYTGSDVHGRFRRAQGWDVFEPFGWDAFGIHSENYALKTGRHPRRLVPANVANFRRQVQRLGPIVDWSRQVDTTDPAYYRWTQWIFLRLFDAGLIYRRRAPVNWCPSCRTVLAAEQAAGGTCERCDSAVEQRELAQWFARITAYAERLLAGIDAIDWSAVTRQAQAHWIGRSDGARVRFAVRGHEDTGIEVFTTRPDTLWGATFLVLAPEHPLVETIATAATRPAVRAYVEAARHMSLAARQKAGQTPTGVCTGAVALHPATGRPLPVWTADYVLTGYGTGAIMAVPAHDRRDHAFATVFGLPVRPVVEPVIEPTPSAAAPARSSAPGPYEGDGVMCDSGPFSGRDSVAARADIAAWLRAREVGGPETQYRLRDWCLSRQRYWGPPIPIVHCAACGPVRVPDADLPVRLPELADYAPDGSGLSPLARCNDFVHTACPACGGAARRDTDVSDNFLDSAWYFLRYPCHDRDDVAFDTDVLRPWLPVHMYIGGNEHAVLHLMYTRFLTMALHELGLLPVAEPFRCFRANGIITQDGAKMSKSKGNVVSPDDLLERLWRYATTTAFGDDDADAAPLDAEVARAVHQAIDKVTRAFEALHYNAGVAAVMELLNVLTAARRHDRRALRTLLQLLSPLAPYITQELWQRAGGEGQVALAPWPAVDPARLVADTVTVVVQVDGKVRARLQLPRGAEAADAETAARGDPRVAARLRARAVRRVVHVPDRLLNLVTAAP